MIKLGLVVFLIIVLLISFVNAGNNGGIGGGGDAVPINTISLDEQGIDYDMKPGRLKFEFNGKPYAIQLRSVNEEYTKFHIMTLDINKPNDITAYALDDTFNLNSGDKREIDLDKDGKKDLVLKLKDIKTKKEKKGSRRFADFSIKKINTKKSETLFNINRNETIEVINSNEIIRGGIQEPILEPVILLDQNSQEESTFFKKMINWLVNYF